MDVTFSNYYVILYFRAPLTLQINLKKLFVMERNENDRRVTGNLYGDQNRHENEDYVRRDDDTTAYSGARDSRHENEDYVRRDDDTTAYGGARENTMLTGMFTDREDTERAYQSLRDRGYSEDEINVIMSDDTRKKHYHKKDGETEIGTKAAEGAGKGSAIGGTIGAIAGVIAAIGTSIAIPGLGIIVAGPLAAGLAGAGAGGIAGGIIGALVGMGIPEERARLYESGVKEGKVVLGVHPKNEEDADYFERNWKDNRGEMIYR
jgi:hypothetical protein